jgi:predicted lipid-binding transport protein (Tim44 family)
MTSKSRILWSLVAAVMLALAPALAEAAAGKSSSQGSRGLRTDQAVPHTQTAPQAAKPMERSATQPQATQPGAAQSARPGQPAAAAAQPSWFQRNPFMAGMMGGLIGAGIGGLLFGHGLFPDGLGAGGMLGMLLQLALVGGIIYLVVAFFRRRAQTQAGPEPAYAGAGAPMERGSLDLRPGNAQGSGPQGSGMGAGAPQAGAPHGHDGGADEIGVSEADLDRFDHMLAEIQAAWSKSDIKALGGLVTPEMLSYFNEQLAEEASTGVKTLTEQVKLEQGSIAEAWAEGNLEYASVALRFSALDYAVDRAGRVADGSNTARVERTEVWTFMRRRGATWLLSAIQQT